MAHKDGNGKMAVGSDGNGKIAFDSDGDRKMAVGRVEDSKIEAGSGGELKIGRMVLGVFQTNCYYVYREGGNEALVFDPADQGDRIYEKLTGLGLKTVGIFLTHGHFDHIRGSEKLKERTGAKLYAYEKEKELCEDPEWNISAQMGQPCSVSPDEYLQDEQEICLAGMTFRVIATPGHTVGGCSYYFKEDRVLISGDTLFEGSVGRTDFPTGSMGTLVRSVKERLFTLPDEVKVYPGHGDETQIGMEKKYNPFCQ